MKRSILAIGPAGVVVVVATALGACGSEDEAAPEAAADAGRTDEPFVESDRSFGEVSTDPDAECAIECSSDLHYVVDCAHNVVKRCNDDQGCAPGGVCVPACDAATANKSAVGCDYYTHPLYRLGANGCYAVFVANTWTTPVKLEAEAQGVPLDVSSVAYIPEGSGGAMTYTPISGPLPPGKVAVVFLEGTCPMPSGHFKEWTDFPDDWVWTTSKGRALHLTASAPVTVYDVFPYGGIAAQTTSASLLLPVSVWDKNYVAVTPLPFGPNCTAPGLSVIASEDATELTLLPTVNVEGNGSDVPAVTANTPHTFSLAKGQVLRLWQENDLTGSILESDKPVGFWADQMCINIDEMACDSAHQQIPPIRALGSEYVGARYRDRIPSKPETPPWRIVGLVDGTTLTWEPEAPADAPTSLGQGEAVTFRSGGDFVVRSQDKDHPFYLNGYMTGGQPYDETGDPEFVNVVPSAQFLTHYMFVTDPSYAVTNLVFVRAKDGGKFSDVSLDCLGTLSDWQPVGTSGQYEVTRVTFDLSCENGVHVATSDAPFGLTVWGWDWWVSYGYPAGMSMQKVHGVHVPPIPR